MQKIIVIGVTGSGKSTLAKKLSTTFVYPHIPHFYRLRSRRAIREYLDSLNEGRQ